jgi:hypothetical protein
LGTIDAADGSAGWLQSRLGRNFLSGLMFIFGALAVRLSAISFAASGVRNGLIRAGSADHASELERLLAGAGAVTHELFLWSFGLLALSLAAAIGAALDRRSNRIVRSIVLPIWLAFAFYCLRDMT